jgi:H+/Cl- antiporter ClcA
MPVRLSRQTAPGWRRPGVNRRRTGHYLGTAGWVRRRSLTGSGGIRLTAPADAVALLRNPAYLRLLVLAGVLGVPVSFLAWAFLALVSKLQHWLFTSLPSGLGLGPAPLWWPLPMLAAGGLVVALAIRLLPGTGGHSPADGLKLGGPAEPREIPGIALAALATLSFGAVLGPEAPLIALGGGLAAWAVSRARAGSAPQVKIVIAAAGSFAAISTLLGNPIVGAFLLMEAAGLGGATMELVLIPGLLAAGIGALVFTGVGHWTGLGAFSLAIPGLPQFSRPNLAEFGWALVIGVAASFACIAIRRSALVLRDRTQRRALLWTPFFGLVAAGAAILFSQVTGKAADNVLFSGQNALGPFVDHAAAYGAGALLLLVACKAIGYSVCMSSFRGGPIFPAIFIGAAGGAAMSHLPGLPLVPALGMGIGAMTAGMLRLPMTSVLLASLLLFSDGVRIMPLVIVAVVAAFVTATRLDPPAVPAGTPAPAAPGPRAPAPSGPAS